MKICIVKLSAMGDIIHSMIALEFLKKNIQNIQIDWIVEEGFGDILQNNPHIDNILTINLKSLKKNKINFFRQIKLLKEYGKNNYDVTIDAQGLLKSAITAKIIRARTIVGFDKNSIREKVASLFYDHKVNISYNSNTIKRNIKVICDYFGIKVTDNMIQQKQRFLFFKEYNIRPNEKYNLFVIGSTWESRNYPKEHFVTIANKLKVLTYIVWGSKEEYQKAKEMENRSKYLKILPRYSLDKLKYIIYHSNLVIGNDTGPTHMAWGLNKPSITIFGPTPINRIITTDINKAIKSKSKVDHRKLNKLDFSICDIAPQEIIKLTKDINV